MRTHLPRNVVLLALASLVADVSGEMLMAVLPFLLVAQGADAVAVGFVGGATDAIGHVVKAVGGKWGDVARRRKPLIIGGYLVAGLSRVGIAVAATWPLTLAFRGIDRVGKGVRTAPRDALLAESVDPSMRGRAFGLHRAADTTGAILGSAGALVALSLLGASTRSIVLAAAAIGVLTVAPLLFVEERSTRSGAADGRRVFEHASARYRAFLFANGVFALGSVSYLFYMLRAADVAGGERGALALYVLFNLVYALLSYPAGALGDRVGRGRVLAAGFALFGASAAMLAFTPSFVTAALAFVALGLGFASVDATQRAMAADLAGSEARSTRLGVFHMTVGLATAAGGLVAGALWERGAPSWAFAWGALVPLVALALLGALGFLRDART